MYPELYPKEKKVFFHHFELRETDIQHKSERDIQVNEMRQACIKIGDAKKIWAKKNLDLTKDQGLINMAPTYSPGTNPSTIGHEGLNYSVRYGKR